MSSKPIPLSLLLTLSALLAAGAARAADPLVPIEPLMVDIPGGAFLMGHVRKHESQPVHTVTIKPFRMGKYEVTAEEFQRFVAATRYRAPRMCMQIASKRWMALAPNDYVAGATLQSISNFEPATCIGWNGADAYVKWLAKETGKRYRLPTEAEWEYAHRAGSTQRYFFGNDETLACRHANLADRSAEAAVRRDFGMESKDHVGVIPCDDKAGYASIVGMYEPNAWGLHDTLGNIAEFVQDCWRDSYAGAAPDGSAAAAAGCSERVVRGGAWHWRGFHASKRGPAAVSWIGGTEGFRVAEDIVPASQATPAPAAARPGAFELALAAAQKAERARRDAQADIPAAPN
jgi:formylglycine-generating enzyme required for sulfatase activity